MCSLLLCPSRSKPISVLRKSIKLIKRFSFFPSNSGSLPCACLINCQKKKRKKKKRKCSNYFKLITKVIFNLQRLSGIYASKWHRYFGSPSLPTVAICHLFNRVNVRPQSAKSLVTIATGYISVCIICVSVLLSSVCMCLCVLLSSSMNAVCATRLSQRMLVLQRQQHHYILQLF